MQPFRNEGFPDEITSYSSFNSNSVKFPGKAEGTGHNIVQLPLPFKKGYKILPACPVQSPPSSIYSDACSQR